MLTELDLCKTCANRAVTIPGAPCPPNSAVIIPCTSNATCFQCLLWLLGGVVPPWNSTCTSLPALKTVFECVIPPCPSCCPYEPFALPVCATTTSTRTTTTSTTLTSTTTVPPTTVPTFGDRELRALLEAWGTCQSCAEDYNQDGNVDLLDVVIVLDRWGQPL